MNFEPYFKHYQMLVDQVETAFEKIKSEFSQCVTCKVGCADCCHALFDLSLIEALYINHQFNAKIQGDQRDVVLERANEADRQIYRLKRNAYKEYEGGRAEADILKEMAAQRVRCPLLNDENQCDLYASRPITCRLYGIPTEIGGQAHTCGLSAFEKGETYPTVKLDQIHKRLYEISFALAQDLKSRYPQLAEMLVPLSMALLTDYTLDYLGVREDQDKKKSGEKE